MKEVRRFYDARTGTQYTVNTVTGDVLPHWGDNPSERDKARILNAVKSRMRAQSRRRERDSVMRDFGLVKVRGALGGTYWE
jgi:hypothetical protein